MSRFPDFRRVWLAIAALIVAAALAGFGVGPARHASAADLSWTNYDVTLTLNTDGSYHVAERQQIDFTGGPFSVGTATIPLTRIDGISNVKVSEISASGSSTAYSRVGWSSYDPSANTFEWTTNSNQAEIDWGFASASFESRTFLLEYDVAGGLRVYPNATPPNQQIWWTAIDKDVTSVAPVDHASMTIVLPQAVALADAVVAGPGSTDPSAHTTDGKTWTWTAANLSSGDSLEVRLQFPTMVNAVAPGWQQADDAQRQAQETADNRKALLNVIFLGVGLGLAALGAIGLYALWYVRGRDPHVGLVAQFLAEPPDDLPAGAMGVLIDEQVNTRDNVASVVDLARRGIIKLDETPAQGGGGSDYTLTLLQPDAKLAPFEATLIGALFGAGAAASATALMSKARGRFDSAAPQMEKQLYQEVVDRGYFTASPEATRERWKHTSSVLLIVVLVAGAIGIVTVGATIAFLWFTIAVAAALAFVLRRLSAHLPARTEKGAEAAAKWLAFRRYLGDINKYEKLDESKAIFEKYLAFAIAFDLDEAYVSQFMAVGAPIPQWFGSALGPVVAGELIGAGRGRGYNQWGGPLGGPIGGGWNLGGPGGGRSSGGGDVNVPGLQGMSNEAAKGVQGASGGFLDMLNKAAQALGSSGGNSSRGSWGGGGGHGGGFSGGGSHGGGGGGGGRGFH